MFYSPVIDAFGDTPHQSQRPLALTKTRSVSSCRTACGISLSPKNPAFPRKFVSRAIGQETDGETPPVQTPHTKRQCQTTSSRYLKIGYYGCFDKRITLRPTDVHRLGGIAHIQLALQLYRRSLTGRMYCGDDLWTEAMPVQLEPQRESC